MSNIVSSFLITGAAGFMGSGIVKRLLDIGENVIGIDNLNNYYDPNLKKKRLIEIDNHAKKNPNKWHFYNASIEDEKTLQKISDLYSVKVVVNLAAQAGVRYSLTNPREYLNSNLIGFFNILEFCKNNQVENFIFASSSSVYGGNRKYPFSETHNIDHPISFYGATKKSNEILAHSYSHLYQLPTTGLRFFTVYGPWGRPDMAPMLFADAVLNEREFDVYNYGDMTRDFTYIDDVIEIIFRCCFKPANKDNYFNYEDPKPDSSFAPFSIFNVGNNKPVKLMDFIDKLALKFGKKAKKNLLGMQIGDVKTTLSDSKKIQSWVNFSPNTPIEKGIEKFAEWYLDFYKL